MNWIKKFWENNWLSQLLRKIKEERIYKKKIAEIKKRDPFIYK